MTLDEWMIKWNVSPAAIADLADSLHRVTGKPGVASEAGLLNAVRKQSASQGVLTMRNNVGAAYDSEAGRFIRYGLANDSKRVNQAFKSSDLVGIKPVTITAEMVGEIIGQFVAYECKKPGWRYSGTPREKAQLAFLMVIRNKGGIGEFIS